ncbi:uncharacterized protein Dvir_GJ16912 [Drosophila virilis]|uniref:Kazal-like domain-containing protein n=1 Tax=Drosophila virilis TaxID=7244 RepID=B4M741_DROVI|nr:uncharacterized protein Dvir_GJ16912 [Drosophila virilis]
MMQRLDLKWTARMAQLLLWSQLISLAVVGSANAAWQYNDEQYAKAQYDKLFGHGQNHGHDRLGPFQYQYVDYQPKCGTGGQPVCATNGTNYFYFENNCKLEAANMKLLFQYGTELEPTELERCLPQCDNIICNKTYAPVCAVSEPGAKQDRGVTFANECEAHRRGCLTKQTMRILRKGPCRDVRFKSRPGSKGKGKRKHGRRRSTTSSTTTTTTTSTTTAATPANRRHIYVRLGNKRSRTTTTTTSSSSTTTLAPMQFHRYMNLGNPHVSVSRAVHAYSVYNIPDVGLNYDAITDSSLSLYVPGVGTITDTPPSTTTTTTSTTTTPKPQAITSTTAIPIISETPKRSSSPREEIKFFYVPYGTTSTTTVSSSSISAAPEVTSTTATIADTIAAATVDRTASTTKVLKLGTAVVARNATGFKVNTVASPKPEIPKTSKTNCS